VSWRDALSMALASASRRFGRTALTVMAVTLASALLVALATMVVTANSRVIRQVSKGGPITAIKVLAAEAAPGQLETDSLRPAEPRDLTQADRDRIADLPGVASTAGVLTAEVLVIPPFAPGVPHRIFEHAVGVDVRESSNLPITLLAGNLPAAGSLDEVAVTQGYLDRMKLDADRPEAVLGTAIMMGAPQVYRRLDGELDYRGRWVRLSIVGVVAQDAAIGEFVVPIEQTRADRAWALGGVGDGERFRLPTSEYSGLVVVAGSLEDVHRVRASIDELGYATSAPEQLVANVRRYLHVVDIVLGGIAVIALVIASLGITSALLAAVRERRSEIGVLKAIGARDRDVLRWFLIEAGFIGAIGGALGTALGVAVALVVGLVVNGYLTSQGLEGVAVVAPVAVVAAGILGSTALAVLAGAIPARRAARLPAREAVGSL
jgi:ABC-type antimicrobial peptide transport system permease subunit